MHDHALQGEMGRYPQLILADQWNGIIEAYKAALGDEYQTYSECID